MKISAISVFLYDFAAPDNFRACVVIDRVEDAREAIRMRTCTRVPPARARVRVYTIVNPAPADSYTSLSIYTWMVVLRAFSLCINARAAQTVAPSRVAFSQLRPL